MALEIVAAALAGLLVGSFLDVVVEGLPPGERLAWPRRRCARCGARQGLIEAIPLASSLRLSRCPGCGARPTRRRPIVELTTAALYVAVVATQDHAIGVVLGLLLATALVPITVIDLDLRIIPNKITGPAAAAAVVAIAALDLGFLGEALIAAAAAGGFFLAAALVNPRGMGMGDVKLAAMLGLYLGRAVAAAVVIALLAGVLVGVAIIAVRGLRAGRKAAVPFGPFLALGGMIAFFVGADLVDDYLDAF